MLRGPWDVRIARDKGENTGRMGPDSATMGFVSWFVKGLALRLEGLGSTNMSTANANGSDTQDRVIGSNGGDFWRRWTLDTVVLCI